MSCKDPAAKYGRVLVKISGEALANNGFGYDWDVVRNVCRAVAKCAKMGVQVGIVVGGGNFWRGAKAVGMERSRADHMGMLATVMNSLALADILEQEGVACEVQTAVDMQRIAEPFTRRGAVAALESGKVVIFGCGTGSPYFSTDTGAVLRGIEINADVVLLAKNIDGIYDADPRVVPDAKRFDRITHQEILDRGLRALDLTATSLALDSGIPLLLFALEDPENIVRAVCGEDVGTIVTVD